jgi:hypothetical protein
VAHDSAASASAQSDRDLKQTAIGQVFEIIAEIEFLFFIPAMISGLRSPDEPAAPATLRG